MNGRGGLAWLAWRSALAPGWTSFSHPESSRAGDRDVLFFRPQYLSDPSAPGAAIPEHRSWPLDDIEGWLDNVIDGIVVGEPENTTIGGRSAVYFEAEITDTGVCGVGVDYCAGFLISAVFDDVGITGWTFEPGFHQRVWWVDGGDEPPLVIIASTPSDDRGHQVDADRLLDNLVIGDPAPHPAGEPPDLAEL